MIAIAARSAFRQGSAAHDCPEDFSLDPCVLLILLFPLSAFGNSMSSNPMSKGSGLIQFGLPIVGVVLVVLLVTGRIG